MRYPDSPVLVSLDMLRTLDADPPGTWLGQCKVDGRRRMIYKSGGQYTWHAKNKHDALPVPADLKAEFEALPWPDGIGLDCEWSGPRDTNGTHELWVFDLLALNGHWYGGFSFFERRLRLYEIINPHECGSGDTDMWRRLQNSRIHRVVTARNNFCALFERQTENPVSEGIVIRKASSTIIGNRSRSVDNPEMFKVKFQRIKS